MDKPTSPLTLLLFVLIVALASIGWNLQTQLQVSRMENLQLRETLRSQVTCAPVQVTCECPDYEEGWGDALFAEGCPTEDVGIDLEQIELICAELDEYGYVPGC
jgi:hypothetical protein